MSPAQPQEFWIRALRHRYKVIDRQLEAGLTQESSERRLGGRPPILWHATHIAGEIESTLEATCLGPGARPAAAPLLENLPLPEVRSEIAELGARLVSRLYSLSEEDLELPPLVPIHQAFRELLTTRAQFLEGHLFHITYHAGAIGLLRAEWGL